MARLSAYSADGPQELQAFLKELVKGISGATLAGADAEEVAVLDQLKGATQQVRRV